MCPPSYLQVAWRIARRDARRGEGGRVDRIQVEAVEAQLRPRVVAELGARSVRAHELAR